MKTRKMHKKALALFATLLSSLLVIIGVAFMQGQGQPVLQADAAIFFPIKGLIPDITAYYVDMESSQRLSKGVYVGHEYYWGKDTDVYPSIDELRVGGEAVIEGNGNTVTADDKVFGKEPLFYVGKGSSLTIRNLTIEGTSGNYSQPLIYVESGGKLTLENCTLRNHNERAIIASGGGYHYWSGDTVEFDISEVTVTGSVFQNCGAYGLDGGAINTAGALYVTNSSFIENKARKGGAIFADGLDYDYNKAGVYVHADDGLVFFYGNTAQYLDGDDESHGGAIYVQSYTHTNGSNLEEMEQIKTKPQPHAEIYTSGSGQIIFQKNSAQSRGGAIYAAMADDNDDYRMKIHGNVQFKENSAEEGGAIWALNTDIGRHSGEYAVEIIGNAANLGGGVYAFYGVRFGKATLSGNTAGERGGGLYVCQYSGSEWVQRCNNGDAYAAYGEPVVVTGSTIISSNKAGYEGGGVYVAAEAAIYSGGVNAKYVNGGVLSIEYKPYIANNLVGSGGSTHYPQNIFLASDTNYSMLNPEEIVDSRHARIEIVQAMEESSYHPAAVPIGVTLGEGHDGKIATGFVHSVRKGISVASAFSSDVSTKMAYNDMDSVYLSEYRTYTFTPDSGTSGEAYSVDIPVGLTMDQFDAPSDWSKRGHTLVGWALTEGGAKAFDLTDAVVVGTAGETTLYPVWTANTYQIKYNANGGAFESGATQRSQNVTFGSTYTLSSVIPTYEGRTFLGWRTLRGKTYIPAGTNMSAYNVAGNTTYYAVWKTEEYELVFENVGGATVGYNMGDVLHEGEDDYFVEVFKYEDIAEYTLPDEIFKPGYDFVGWEYKERVYDYNRYEELMYEIYVDADPSSGEQFVITAVFEPKMMTATFDGNGGQIADVSHRVLYLNDLHLPLALTVVTPKEYSKLVGWEIEGERYEIGEDVQYVWTRDVTVKAVWQQYQFAVMPSLSEYPDATLTGASACSFWLGANITNLWDMQATLPGYTFAGWRFEGTETVFGRSDVISPSTPEYAEIIEAVMAQDELVDYTVYAYPVFTANTNTPYRVYAYIFNPNVVNEDGTVGAYERFEDNYLSKTGTTGTMTSVASFSDALLEGISIYGVNPDQHVYSWSNDVIIAGDGSTVAAIYYDVKELTLIVSPNYGIFANGVTEKIEIRGYYGEDISAQIAELGTPTKVGFELVGWTYNSQTYDALPVTLTDTQVWTATWQERSDIVSVTLDGVTATEIYYVGENIHDYTATITYEDGSTEKISTGEGLVIMNLRTTTEIVNGGMFANVYLSSTGKEWTKFEYKVLPKEEQAELTFSMTEMMWDRVEFPLDLSEFVGGCSSDGELSFALTCADESVEIDFDGRSGILFSVSRTTATLELIVTRAGNTRYNDVSGQFTISLLPGNIAVSASPTNQQGFYEIGGEFIPYELEVTRYDGTVETVTVTVDMIPGFSTETPSGENSWISIDFYYEGVRVRYSYKVWWPQRNVTYDLNGGSGSAPIAMGYRENAELNINETTATKAGYTFIGWLYDYDGQIYQPNDVIIIPEKDITFTAQWQLNEVTLSVDTVDSNNALNVVYDCTQYVISVTPTIDEAIDSEVVFTYQWVRNYLADGTVEILGRDSAINVQNVADSDEYLCYVKAEHGGQSVSSSISVTVRINKSEGNYAPNFVKPTDLVACIDQDTMDVSLPEGWEWVGYVEILEEKEYTCLARFVPTDLDNYNVYSEELVILGSPCDGDPATCTEPKTCARCGRELQGALGHDWKDATCTEPKTCKVCEETEGNALGHTHGDSATCTNDQTCTKCGTVLVEALGHNYTEQENNTIRTTAQNCQEYNTYWCDCSRCGESAKNDASATNRWYASNETGAHNMSNDWTSENGQHFHKCTVNGCTHTEDVEDCYGGHATCQAKAVCDVCGTSYGEIGDHNYNYGSWGYTDENGHANNCIYCDAHTELQEHEPNVDAATEDTAKYCTFCGYVIEQQLNHVHSEGTAWEYDSEYHWHDCVANDGQVYSKAEHTYDNACDTTCNVCNATRTITHDYSKLEKNDTEHWYVCSVCGSEKANSRVAHSGGMRDCQHKAECATCGHTYGEFGDHVYDTTEWVSVDNDHHAHKCTLCDAYTDTTEHFSVNEETYTEDKICDDCGYVMASALGFELNNVIYKILTNEEGNLTVEVYGNTLTVATNLTIPTTVINDGKEYSVVSVGEDAFRDCDYLTGLTISEGVKSIAKSAFENCSALLYAELPQSITTIGIGVFCNCEELKTVNIPYMINTIEEWTFNGCHKLENIEIPEGVSKIGYRAFYNCYTLKSIVIPYSVESIGKTAFYGCDGLEEIRVYSMKAEIGENAIPVDISIVYCDSAESTIAKYCAENGINYQTHEGEHVDKYKDHICDYGCSATLGVCEDKNLDHICDYGCEKTYGEHYDGEDNDHLCDYGCKKVADDGCYDTLLDGKCDECGEAVVHDCSDKNKNHECDVCGKSMGNHSDSATDSDHTCDYGCGERLEECKPNKDDGDCTTDITCSICGTVITEGADSHTGGTATCTAKAECDVCGKEYGEKLPHSHGKDWVTDANNHWNECECGDKANKTAHTDLNKDGRCDVCNYKTATDGSSSNSNKKLSCRSVIGGSSITIYILMGAVTFFIFKKRKSR